MLIASDFLENKFLYKTTKDLLQVSKKVSRLGTCTHLLTRLQDKSITIITQTTMPPLIPCFLLPRLIPLPLLFVYLPLSYTSY